MNCPLDGNELALAERQGIEIDYCPRCRGVWLDRGELDKIIERSDRDDDDDDRRSSRGDDRRRDDDRGYDKGKPFKKKKNLLSELFEFGG